MNIQRNPSCIGMFDPLAGECSSCAIINECIHQQEKQLSELNGNMQNVVSAADTNEVVPEEEVTEEIAEMDNEETVEESVEESNAQKMDKTNAQIIRKHMRKRLEIPTVGTKLFTTYKGENFEAVVIDDPENQQTGGRSILFNGEVYKTLTAAAHAIAPGIHSGSVWQPA